ncbi:hypothetical protein [Kineococcus rubinsiae]|uniref:hypothetical protein n=1 Tax=Kineococcus rubinsiae TaxID=2609562 RepID=UPI00143164FA|nr:hypothetical protein [Kineococcus rubinsiae]NIZ90302.1 hypothetical protein [Kineococcus rubinsiae]
MIDSEDHFETRLRQQLHDTAEQLPVPEGLSRRAHSAGVRRHRHRRVLQSVPLAAVLVGVGVLGWSHPWAQEQVPLTPATSDPHVSTGTPLDVTPDVERAVTALQPHGLQEGTNDPFIQEIPVAADTTPVSCSRLSEHLGITLPTFPRLRGYRMLCTSGTGDAIFDRDVPLTGSGVTDADLTQVEIFYLPPSVDEQTATTAEAAAEGMSWILLSYGSDLQAIQGQGQAHRPDATSVTLNNDEPAVVQLAESGTSIGWISTSSGHSYGLTMYQPRTALNSIEVFSRGTNVPM